MFCKKARPARHDITLRHSAAQKDSRLILPNSHYPSSEKSIPTFPTWERPNASLPNFDPIKGHVL
jgi:hypothetical protein